MNVTILIVDDEAPVRKVLKAYLTKAGYECYTAEEVASAKKELTSKKFDLLLCDLNLSGENSGLDLIRYAKENYPQVGRIMITGFDSPEIASEILSVGVYGYIIKPFSRSVVLITVENALRHLRLDMHMQACKIELEQKINRRTEKLTAIMNNLSAGLVMVNTDMQVIELNRKMQQWFPDISVGTRTLCYHALVDTNQQTVCDDCPMLETLQTGRTCEATKKYETTKGIRDFRIVSTSVKDESGRYAGIAFYDDVTESMALEKELRQAQKLEAVGQLAAGIAHEINTPVQYIGDNLSFLQDSYDDIAKVLQTYDRLWQKQVKSGAVSEEMQKELSEEIENADLEYLFEEIPSSFGQSLGGVQKVNKIVRAMKDFSHPGNEEKTLSDINTILETTITVCRNEWKYVAEVKQDLAADLQPVPCFSSEISQVLLNIIVNGAHAIDSFSEGGRNGMGTISIATRQLEEAIQIRISDTGGGIPEEIQERVFETFFTTKERGKGTGQGLAIAHRVVTDMHQGKIFFESEQNCGTTFIIELPLNPGS